MEIPYQAKQTPVGSDEVKIVRTRYMMPRIHSHCPKKSVALKKLQKKF